MNKQKYWETVYRTKIPSEVSWFQPHLDSSLQLIASIGLDPDAGIIDVGCGASTLVDDLLSRGCTNVTCMDISAEAVMPTKQRLGKLMANVC
jgi:2-polyprenyl-3-methyl-5-hydroxy-6-metoxy-1,4-benzoquinol methylase